MNELQKKSKSELVEIIIRKDNLERELREEMETLQSNDHSMETQSTSNGNKKHRKFSTKEIWLIAISFAVFAYVTARSTGLLAVILLCNFDFPTLAEEYDAARCMIKEDYILLAFYLCVCIEMFLIEFFALHIILHIKPFKTKQ